MNNLVARGSRLAFFASEFSGSGRCLGCRLQYQLTTERGKIPVIELAIEIGAPIERVFDLARSIDLHVLSAEGTGERAVAGVTRGLIELGQEVTWRARHFGIWQQLTSRITAYQRPDYFRDSLVRGAFRR